MGARRILQGICLAVASLTLCGARGETPPVPEATEVSLTLQEAIERALRQNLDLVVERFEPEKASRDVTGARSAFDPTFTGSWKDSRNEEQTVSSLSGAPSLEENVETRSIGLTEKLPTGTTVTTSLDHTRSTTNNSFVSLSPRNDLKTTLTVRQSLLKGFGTAPNLAGTRIAERDHEAARAGLAIKAADVVSRVERAYWDLVAAREDVTVKRTTLEAARGLETETRAKRAAGAATQTDLLETASEAASREADLIEAERKEQDAQDHLRQIIDPIADGGSWARLVYRPADAPVVEGILPDEGASIDRAVSRRPEMIQSRKKIDAARLRLAASENNLLPDLSVSATYARSGLDRDRAGSLDDLQKGNNEYREYALLLEIPLGNRRAASANRRRQAELAQEIARGRALGQQIVVEVRTSIRALDQGRRRLAAQERAAEFAREKARAEGLRFDQGLSTIHQVLESLAVQAREEARLVSARIDQLKAASDWRKAQGSLLADKGVQID